MTGATIQKIIGDRGITEVVHFTSNCGLLGCLAASLLLSTKRVRKEKWLSYIFGQTALTRKEENIDFNKDEDWIDYISLSISEINQYYFGYALEWHANKDIFWTILSFDSAVMTHEGVYFTTTNNSYDKYVIRGHGCRGLSRLFEPKIHRMNTWHVHRDTRASMLTTCQQAEVLYPRSLSLEFLRRVYVQEGEQADIVKMFLRKYDRTDVEVCVDKTKFLGCPN